MILIEVRVPARLGHERETARGGHRRLRVRQHGSRRRGGASLNQKGVYSLNLGLSQPRRGIRLSQVWFDAAGAQL